MSLVTVPFECRVGTSLAGEAYEAEELIAVAQAGRIRVYADHIDLEAVPLHLDLLDNGQGPKAASSQRSVELRNEVPEDSFG